MTQRETPFLIAGGGIGGLGAALALAEQGIACHVLERAGEFREVGAGIQLGPNAFHCFRALGIAERILRDVWQPGNIFFRNAVTGERIAQVPLGDGFHGRFGAPYTVTHRHDLHLAILEACQAHPLITLQTQARVVDFEDTGAGVRVSLESGATLDGQALIGADGLWSSIRERIVGDGAPRVSGHIAYRAVLPRAEVPEDLWDPDVMLWAGPRTHLVHYPLRRGEIFNLVAVFHSDKYVEGWDASGDIAELMLRFQGQRPEVLRLLEKIETWRMWVLCDREPVKLWHQGRTVLLGDAAHPMLQYLAQGAAMALEDAVVLARSIAANRSDLPAAFASYTQARYLRTGRVQTVARLYGDIYHARGVVGELRDQMVKNATATAEKAWTGMSWLYGAAV